MVALSLPQEPHYFSGGSSQLEEKNISQEKFAEEIGISVEDAGRFFHGQDLNDSNMEKIWKFLNK